VSVAEVEMGGECRYGVVGLIAYAELRTIGGKTDVQGVTYLDSDWTLNPIVRRDVPVYDLLSSIGGSLPRQTEIACGIT
jgi:hypothetical protein